MQYYTCMVLSGIALLILSGFSIILIKQAQNYIATNWDSIVADVRATVSIVVSVSAFVCFACVTARRSAECGSVDRLPSLRRVSQASASKRQKLDEKDEKRIVMQNMALCSAACAISLVLVGSVLSNVVRLVSRISAYSLLLQVRLAYRVV